MSWMYSRSTPLIGILAAASVPMACEVSDVDDETLEEVGSPEHELIVLKAEADTYVRTDVDARRNDNYGCQALMEVGTGRGGNHQREGAPDAMRSLVRFDLSGVDVEHVFRATLELSLARYDSGIHDSVYHVQAHAVRPSHDHSPWLEGNGLETTDDTAAVPPGCTNPDDAYGVAWQGGEDPLNVQGATLGLDNQTQPSFDPAVVGSVTIDQGVHSPGAVFRMDVTHLVNGWLSGTIPNEGIMLRDVTTDGDFRGVGFGTCEGEEAGGVKGPRLVIQELQPPFPYVEITALESVVTLRWEPRPSATYYVYRGSEPDFGDGTLVASGLTVGEYSESFAPDDPDAYYRIVEDAPGPDTRSAIVGRIPAPVLHSTSHAYSKIPLCLVPQPDDAIQRMLQDERPLSIHWWNADLQRFEFEPAPFESVLAFDVGEQFAVRTAPDAHPGMVDYQTTGRVPTEDELSVGLTREGLHAVVWPVTADPKMASELSIPDLGLVAVGRWNPSAQRVEWYQTPDRDMGHVPGVTNTTIHDFEVEPCTPLYVYIDELIVINGQKVPIFWPESVG